MGSFNVACSVSNISIGAGDPVAYIPLEVARYPYHIGDGNDMLIYTHCFYAPVTMPIFGTYDDYGGVENIEKNKNTEIVEEYFGIPIDEVIGIKRDEDQVGTISSGMFIHRKIYDIIVKKCSIADEWGGISSPIFEDPRNDPMLSLTNSLDKYIKEVQKATKLHKDCMEMPFLKDKKRKSLWKTACSITKSPIKHVEGVIILRKLEASVKRMRKSSDNFFLASISSIFKFRDYGVFNTIYQPKIIEGELREEIIEFVLFECGMGATNNFYFPAMNGYQCGNLYASRFLYWESLKITIKDILYQKYHGLTPKEIKWSIRYRIIKMKKRWKKLWQR